MQFLTPLTLLTLTLAPHISADMLSSSSLPQSCMAICGPVVELTNKCDLNMEEMMMNAMNKENEKGGMEMNMNMPMKKDKRQMSMDMDMDMSSEEMDMQEQKAEMGCVCTNKSFDVSKVMGLCASCLGMDMNGNKTVMEAVEKMMSGCSFPTTSYAPAATSVLSGLRVEATMPAITMMAGDMGDMNMNGSMTGAASKVEVATRVWGVGMLVASFGLGAGFVFGMM